MAKTMEAELPTREQAREAFTEALTPRQARLREALDRIADDPPQVLILEGGTADERASVALWHAARLNCRAADKRPCLECPPCLQIGAGVFKDLFFLDGREGSIKIEQVRELRGILGEPPRGDGRRVVIFAEAQALGTEAANALLKSLEEPRPGVCFLLLAPQRQRLLPTLVSRGWTLTLPWPAASAPLTPELREWESALARFAATGQGWFALTSRKGAVDAPLARTVIALVQKTLADALAGRAPRAPGSLGEHLANLPDLLRLELTDLLTESQTSVDALVNPALVLDRLAIRLHALGRRAGAGIPGKKHSARRTPE